MRRVEAGKTRKALGCTCQCTVPVCWKRPPCPCRCTHCLAAYLPGALCFPPYRYQRELPISAEYLLENLLDPAHVSFAHHGVIGRRTRWAAADGSDGQLEMVTASACPVSTAVEGRSTARRQQQQQHAWCTPFTLKLLHVPLTALRFHTCDSPAAWQRRSTARRSNHRPGRLHRAHGH